MIEYEWVMPLVIFVFAIGFIIGITSEKEKKERRSSPLKPVPETPVPEPEPEPINVDWQACRKCDKCSRLGRSDHHFALGECCSTCGCFNYTIVACHWHREDMIWIEKS